MIEKAMPEGLHAPFLNCERSACRLVVMCNFATAVAKINSVSANLSERRFRDLWEQADRKSPEFRFHDVIELLQAAPEKPVRHKPVGDDIRRKVADGKWHNLDVIADKIEADRDHVQGTLDRMCREESFHCKAERKRVGIGYAYRFKLDRAISSSEIAEKLEPLLKGFEAAKAAPAV